MKTSLIIPAWNAEKTILDCILSAIEANDSPEEIIIVDDCSDDKTANLILNFNKTILIYSWSYFFCIIKFVV